MDQTLIFWPAQNTIVPFKITAIHKEKIMLLIIIMAMLAH